MSTWLAILVPLGILLVTIAGFLGIRAAFTANKNTQTITNYEKSLASWKERAESAESDRDHCRGQMTVREAAYDALEQKFDILSNVVSGKAAIERVGEEARQYWAETSGQLEAIVGILKNMDPRIKEALRPVRRRAAPEGDARGSS